MSAEPITILRVIARLNVGGPALHVAYLTEGLSSRGYDTTLVAGTLARGEASMEHIAAARGVSVVALDDLSREISPLADLRSVLTIVRLIRRHRPQILHTHTAKAGAVGRIAARLAGDARPRVIVHTFHGHVLRGYFGPLKTRFFRVLERGLARWTTTLVAVSPEVRDDLVALGVAPAEKFAVVRLGIELDERVAAADVRRDEIRRTIGIPADAFVVGWVGRMTAVKRTPDVLEAFARLAADDPGAVLLLVGDGPDREPLERLAHRLGIAKRCRFVGYQDDVGPFYSALDVLLLPSANEGTPVSVIEALAAGRPVVATRVGGVPDVVTDGVDGFVVGAGDIAALGERLVELARDPALRAEMARNGRERVVGRYAVERLVDDTDRLYRTLLAGRAPQAA
ncbi:MAG TPA: glycosyltransferase family 4 protein [Gaiellaceae bacterium]|nr:glycosyltransferase family 4 protein [Gaiellaceae bacterium]